MKLQQVNYDDREDLKSIVVLMKKNEAVALCNLLGKLNGIAHEKLSIDSDMYDCLNGVFNREYEEGCPSLNITLEEINYGQ